MPKNAEEIEVEAQEDNKDFLETAVEFNKVGFKVSEDEEKKEIADLFDQIKENEELIDPEIQGFLLMIIIYWKMMTLLMKIKNFFWNLLTELIFLQIEKFLMAPKIQKCSLSKMRERLSLRSMRRLLRRNHRMRLRRIF